MCWTVDKRKNKQQPEDREKNKSPICLSILAQNILGVFPAGESYGGGFHTFCPGRNSLSDSSKYLALHALQYLKSIGSLMIKDNTFIKNVYFMNIFMYIYDNYFCICSISFLSLLANSFSKLSP